MKRTKKKQPPRPIEARRTSDAASEVRAPLGFKPWQNCLLILLLAAFACGSLAWLCLRDPKINFLAGNDRAEWIVFPKAMIAGAQRIANLDTKFRREFVIEAQPQTARLKLRAAKYAEVKINGTPVGLAAGRNWKDIADVAVHLQSGRNLVEVRIFNDNAPPALWLQLKADAFTLQSDSSWEASCADSAWRSAAAAGVPRSPGSGHSLADGKTVGNALPAVWVRWLIFAAIAVVMWFAGNRWLGSFSAGDAPISNREITILLASLAILLLLLFINNARLMPFLHGFDSQDHLNYIKYVQERRALPLPTEGFEMFQPPLFYLLAAVVLSVCSLSADAPAAIIVLRLLTFTFAALQCVLVMLSLRIFFPGRRGAQFVGLGLACLLPMQLYLSHYVTNETLAATLVAASVYLALRLVRTKNPSTSQFALLGLCTGAAMLTKATALLLIGPLLVVLIIRFVTQSVPVAKLLRQLGVAAAVFLAACGWHYIRIWLAFGTPLVGNWDPAAGFPWWQDPGFHTSGDYFRFGQSLSHPFFSGVWSFADGIYSTLWGDALWGGVPASIFRPPWNYDLMAAGYLPAIVPTLIIFVGAAAALWRFVRQPTLEWLLMFGLSGVVTIGLIFMTLKVPSYAQVKSFYGLAALIPICFFAATGWELLTRRKRVVRGVLGVFLLFFAINSFASFWVVRSARQRVYAGARLELAGKTEAAIKEGSLASEGDPANATAERLLASLLNEGDRAGEALPHAQRAVELDPRDGACHLQLGMVLARHGQLEGAISEAHRAIELGPENLASHNFLLSCLSRANRGAEVIDVARNALAVFPSSFELHNTLGVALAKNGELAGAADHFVYGLQLQPELSQSRQNLRRALRSMARNSETAKQLYEVTARADNAPVVLNEVAWFYSTHANPASSDGSEAVRLAERAAGLTNNRAPEGLAVLSAAYAQAGRIPEAIKVAEEARERARTTGDSKTEQLTQKMLATFQANRPYHE